MVVIFLPTASLTEVWQDRTASPLTWTVQAPHRPAPQPNFVPVICNCSRMTQSSGVSLAASRVGASSAQNDTDPIQRQRNLESLEENKILKCGCALRQG